MPGHKIWTVGEEVIAADFQGYVQDQLVSQFPNVAARDTWGAPPIGALAVTTDTLTVWQYNGSAWVTFPPKAYARVHRTAAQSIPNNAATAISFQAQRSGTAGLWNVANPTRLVAPDAGWYSVGGAVQFAPNAAGIRYAAIRANGTISVATQQTTPPPGAIFGQDVQVQTELELAAGAYVELVVYQNSGGALNASLVSMSSPEAWITRLSAL